MEPSNEEKSPQMRPLQSSGGDIRLSSFFTGYKISVDDDDDGTQIKLCSRIRPRLSLCIYSVGFTLTRIASGKRIGGLHTHACCFCSTLRSQLYSSRCSYSSSYSTHTHTPSSFLALAAIPYGIGPVCVVMTGEWKTCMKHTNTLRALVGRV